MILSFETVSFQTFEKQYMNKLNQPSCIPKSIEELCGGWGTQETLKQIVQKITKKNQAPLPLVFDSPESMEAISIKKQVLVETFRIFDTRGIGRIDATEVFTVILVVSKGDIEVVLANIVEIFGADKNSIITQEEFFFFLDSLFRGLSKVCIPQGYNNPIQVNKRLSSEEIKQLVQSVFLKSSYLEKDNFYNNFMKTKQLYEFMNYIIESLQNSLEYARQQSLQLMKISLEVKKVIIKLIQDVEKAVTQPALKK